MGYINHLKGAYTNKALKTAFESSKLNTEKKPHLLDKCIIVVETSKNKDDDATVMGAGGAGLVDGYEKMLINEYVLHTDHEPQYKNIASANAIIGDLKQAK